MTIGQLIVLTIYIIWVIYSMYLFYTGKWSDNGLTTMSSFAFIILHFIVAVFYILSLINWNFIYYKLW